MSRESAVSVPSEQDADDPRERRIRDYVRDSLKEGDAFQASLRAATADLMDIGYRLAAGVKAALGEGPASPEDLDDLAPAINNLLLVDRQIARFAQLDLQWSAAEERRGKVGKRTGGSRRV
jgi:hypothetical protein